MATSGILIPTILDCFFTVSRSHFSTLLEGLSMTIAPVILLAIHLEIANEIKAPPNPKIPEKITKAFKLRSLPF